VLEAVALFSVVSICVICYLLFVAYSAAKEAGGDAEKRNRVAWIKVREDFERTVATGKAWAVAVWGLAKSSIAEHLPLLRSRAISGGLILKFIAVAGWLLPEHLRDWLTNHGADMLMVLAAGAMFARIVQGRVNARGPLLTPRDREAGAMGPGSSVAHEEEVAGVPAASFSGGPRTFPV